MEETDADGYTHPKSLEFFFNGIIGHLRDRWGGPLDYDRLCSQLANCWRSWFRSPTIGPVFEYEDHEPWTNQEQTPTVSASPAPETAPATEPQIPVQVLQGAWLLNSVIEAQREEHPELTQEIRNTPPGTFRDLSVDRLEQIALVHLSMNMAIMINRLVKKVDPNSPFHLSEREEDHL